MKKFSHASGLVVSLTIVLLGSSRLARADEAQPALPSERPDSVDQQGEAPPDHLRLGAIAGVGFPRPLAVEALAVFERTAAVGLEYGVMPSVTIDGVKASLWSLAGDARVLPFRGAFFVGLRAGLQHLEGATRTPWRPPSFRRSTCFASASFCEQSAEEGIDEEKTARTPGSPSKESSRSSGVFGVLAVQSPSSAPC